MTEITEFFTTTFDTEEAASFLGMSEAWIRKAVHLRTLPFIKIGRAVRFKRSDLEAFLDAKRIEPAKAAL